jgi:predicted TIM-barrel fold metal-dependent hydrolase
MDTLKIPKHIIAIDTHVHPNAKEHEKSDGEYVAVAKKYFKTDVPEFVSFEEMAEIYRAKQMMCVLLGKDARTNTGLPPITNESLAEAVRSHPDVFIGFGAVDPYMGKWAADETHRIADLGLRGLKFQQIFQGFYPNDPKVYPIYEAAQKLGLVVLFHMGTTGIGAGAPGGMGLRLKYGQPMHIDDVAADFPQLTIIAAHPGWPWSDEVLAIAVHKSNVFVDMSGWAPKYFPPNFVQYARTLLQDKMLFGSDWPLLSVDRWQKEFAEYRFPEPIIRKIMLENAKRVLRLEQ